jgi:hypothetical protein
MVSILLLFLWRWLTNYQSVWDLDPNPFKYLAYAIVLTPIIIGVWANTLYHQSQDSVNSPDSPQKFDRLLMIVPTLFLIASCMLAAILCLALKNSDPYPPDMNFWYRVIFAFMHPMTYLAALLVFFILRSQKITRFIFDYGAIQAERANAATNEAVEARMAALRSQMNPHFLFNTLNTVAALLRTSPPKAEIAVEQLAQMLRRTLDHTSTSYCTLDEELDHVKAYLAVEQIRMGDRLKLTWSVADETRNCQVPTMTLQPLLENALNHGIGNLIEGGHIHIQAHRRDHALFLAVEDDGQGLPPNYTEQTGLGNLRKRLQTLFGERAALHLTRLEQGTSAVVYVPFEIAAEEQACAS